MKINNDRSAFYGKIGETIDIYQAEHAVSAAFTKLGGYSSATRERCKVVVGHDAGPAADMMTSAVCAAICAAGANVITLGQVPSGAVSFLTGVCDAVMGVMITGSSFDGDVSGLKFYNRDGNQVTGEMLQSIHDATEQSSVSGAKKLGSISPAGSDIVSMYLRNLIEAAGNTVFERIKIAVDCAGSACAPFVKYVLNKLGADVTVMDNALDSDKPGVTSYENPSALINYVRDTESNIGFAFSADGEICKVALPDGRFLDSERLAEVFGRVYGKGYSTEEVTPVIMVSDNCHVALAPYIKSMGAEAKTVTGDYSYLAEEYAADKSVIMAVDRMSGIVFPRRSFVPDGLMTAIMLLSCMNHMGMTIGELSSEVPKLIRSVSTVIIPSGAFIPVLRTTDLEEEIRVKRSYLSGDGRVLMTRPEANKVEIIVEGIKAQQVNRVIEEVEALVRKNLRIPDGATVFRRPTPPADKEPAPAEQPAAGE
ncbi:MAG: hypothetical protein IJM51_12085 [Clostridia bacterium]|nr:hypothetical protein [Clostridia bacterium]